jgi:hypothetical protein
MTTPSIHNNVDGSDLLTKLLNKGDNISIVQGRLLIKPSSGLDVPQHWLKQHEPLLINNICNLFNIAPLKYESYSTGRYEYRGKKIEGITLQFLNLQTNEDAYLIYNASLKRTRKSNNGNKGEQLPGKQFIVSERCHFYKFWCLTGLPLPRSLSKFYECMGKLKSLTFTGNVDFNNRITDKKLSILEVSYQQIVDKKSILLSGKINTNLTAKEPLRLRQGTAKTSLSFTAKHIELDHIQPTFPPNQSTGASKYGNTVIRKEVIREAISSDITPVNNENSKEIDDYENGEISPVDFQDVKHKRPEDQTVDEWLSNWENSFTPEEFQKVMSAGNKNAVDNCTLDKAS